MQDTPNPLLATAFRAHFEKAAAGGRLTEAEAKEAFMSIMQGWVSEIELAGFLVALKARGETVDEIAGAAAAMRSLMVPVTAPEGAVDVVGTGGDAKGTLNISTATAFVLAGAGVPVAKHGNRAVSSKSGAADVLEKLGVNIKLAPEQLSACFERAGLAFLWAPAHHPAMRYAAPVRQGLKLRTIFNLLGPLLNPASTKRQLIGTYDAQWLKPMAEVMQRAGAIHVWVVHGADGMDELSTTGMSHVVELRGGRLSSFKLHPKEAGLPLARLSDLQGGTPEDSAIAMRALLRGQRGPFRDIVLLNAAAAFLVAGRVRKLKEGVALAAASIDEGRAAKALDALVAASHGEAPAQGGKPLAAASGPVSVLGKIVAYKREEVAASKAKIPLATLEDRARAAPSARRFRDALRRKLVKFEPALIAEIKKASPSQGLIRADFDPASIARAYERGGAACLSVLTDGPSFQGSAEALIAARAATALPVLRKDFMVDPYQVPESRAMGADCILIIMACTSDALAGELIAAAQNFGMDALVEIHNEEELSRALALCSAIIGINNRDLKSFETHLETTEKLAALIPGDRLIVSESGIFTPKDIARLRKAGAHAFLVGESLMRQEDIESATRALLASEEDGARQALRA